ncbi:hypothetical protein [Amycolatopsis sp. NBC_01286]|uniref:hypothetical protein n=1 Tax=Amycolatopsis sp. NBC_01286 TaxID=2903560 RepID=UPI002E0F716E|nr:hypothetical protein OG570_29070 [Amycolatopsis sp. NBC_01286]
MISILGDIAPPVLSAMDQSDELRGYTALRPEHGQPVNFVAVMTGVKPSMDDWVTRSQLDEYVDMCRNRGLYVTANAQFAGFSGDDSLADVIGKETLTTTRAAAHTVAEDVPNASVHVFVGRDRQAVDRTRWSGWYPLVSGGRASSKPWIDHYWFGEGLGYPSCCTEAFARHNNWSVNNMPYQAWRSTQAPSALCNSTPRFTGLTWTAHLPCRYDCAASITLARETRAAVRRHSVELADYVDNLTARPCLVLNEWETFSFDGTCRPSSIQYEAVALMPSNKPNRRLFEALQAGSRVEIRDDLVVIFNSDDVVWIEQCRVDGFAPRVPFFLDFSAGAR